MELLAISLIGVCVVAVAAGCLFRSCWSGRKVSFSVSGPFRTVLTIGCDGVSFGAPSICYPRDGFSVIEAYIGKMLVAKKRYGYLQLFTRDGERGVGVVMHEGVFSVNLLVRCCIEKGREESIRDFFQKKEIRPTEDYLAKDGDVEDGASLLQYKLKGDAKEISILLIEILEGLCGVARSEPLYIRLKTY